MNVLLFFTDQQRSDTIGALGNDKIHTPNLDRLVREGVAFTNAYSPSPMCVPARASMHYGQYPAKTRCLCNEHATTPDDRDSFMDILTHAGYETLGVGKCHFRPDGQALRGFSQRLRQEESPARVEDDEYLQFMQASPYRDEPDVHGVWREMLYMPQSSKLPEAYHPTQWVADRTIDFIRGRRQGNAPWFVFSSFIHPHPPYSAPHPWDKMYEIESLSAPYRPEGYEDRQPAFKKAQLHHYYFDPPTSDTLWRMVKSRYYGCVSFIDHQVGRVLEALEQTNQLDDTLILFTSDHGEMLGDLGLIGKSNMYAPAVQVPLLMRGPNGAGAGERIDVPTNLVDVAPTVVRAAGQKAPDTWDGEDLVQIAQDPSAYSDRVVLSHMSNPDRGVYMSADRQYKYVYSGPDNWEQFFDYRNDPREETNLIDSADHQGLRRRLKAKLVDYLRKNNFADGVLTDEDDWQVYDTEISMPRTTSNTPCRWWDRLKQQKKRN